MDTNDSLNTQKMNINSVPDVLENKDSASEINIEDSVKTVTEPNHNEKQISQISEQMDIASSSTTVGCDKNTSLGLLAGYGSSSETDSETDEDNLKNTPAKETTMVVDQTIKIIQATNEDQPLNLSYQANVAPSKDGTSSLKSDSEDSEPDSDSDDDILVPGNEPIPNAVDGPYRVASSSDDENSCSDSDVEEISHADLDEFLNTNKDKNSKHKNRQTTCEEGIESLPPIEDLKITVAEDECVELGKITSIVEQLVLVDSLPGTVPLNLDTVLFLDKGNKALGKVFDVIGNVANPMYCVRFNSNEEIKTKNIEINSIVYVAPRTEHTSFVCISDLMKEKKTDASKENDNECTSDSEYSDDEMERQRRSIKLGKNKARSDNVQNYDANKYMRGTYRSPRGNRGNPRSFHRPPRQYYGNQRPMRPPQQQPDNYYYSWHSNYQQQHHHHQQSMQMRPLMFPNPYAMPPPRPYSSPYIPSNLMQQPLFPPPTQIPKIEPENR